MRRDPSLQVYFGKLCGNVIIDASGGPLNPYDDPKMTKMRFEARLSVGQIVPETLWVTILGNGNYRLENTPRNHGLRHRDIVKGDFNDDGWLVYDRFVMRAEPV